MHTVACSIAKANASSTQPGSTKDCRCMFTAKDIGAFIGAIRLVTIGETAKPTPDASQGSDEIEPREQQPTKVKQASELT